MTAALDHIADLARFVQTAPSSFHAVEECARRMREAGFTQLSERDEWPAAQAGDAHFVVRDGAVIAWMLPARVEPTSPFRIVGAHTDSPGFKLKPQPTIGAHGWLQVGVEVYGGPLLNSWLDRELELAGRLILDDGSEHVVRTGPFVRIPQLAIHLDRDVNNGLTLVKQAHLSPIFGVGDVADADIVGHLATLAGVSASQVAGYDIVVADTAPPQTFGLDNQLFASGRLDNLSSVHAGLTALLAAASARRDAPPAAGQTKPTADRKPVEPIAVFAAFDHEEVGSETRSGAAGTLLNHTLERIAETLGASRTEHRRALADSWVVSADAGHAVHPNYAECHDPANRPLPGAGPLLKINANQRYATDATGAAEWARACTQADVPYQKFVSNNDIPCGSTIGPITATVSGIRTIDVGIPLLSMHSAREMCGTDDPIYLSAALSAFYTPQPPATKTAGRASAATPARAARTRRESRASHTNQ